MSNEIIDLPDFQDRVQDDKDLMLELFEIFMEDYQVKRGLLGDAIKNKNYEEIKSIGHSLKGASGNISAKQLRGSLLKLEDMGKASNISGVESVLADLDRQYAALVKRIAEIKKEFQP